MLLRTQSKHPGEHCLGTRLEGDGGGPLSFRNMRKVLWVSSQCPYDSLPAEGACAMPSPSFHSGVHWLSCLLVGDQMRTWSSPDSAQVITLPICHRLELSGITLDLDLTALSCLHGFATLLQGSTVSCPSLQMTLSPPQPVAFNCPLAQPRSFVKTMPANTGP